MADFHLIAFYKFLVSVHVGISLELCTEGQRRHTQHLFQKHPDKLRLKKATIFSETLCCSFSKGVHYCTV